MNSPALPPRPLRRPGARELRPVARRPTGRAALALGVLVALSFASAARTVVVSFQPIHSVVERVAGPSLNVERAAPIGASPHDFDPTPRDIVRLKRADLAVMAGLGADNWLERYVRASGSRARTLELGRAIEFEPIRIGAETDPHWWLDASLMALAATEVGEALAKLDPPNAQAYRDRAKKEAADLNALHDDLKRSLAPVRGARIVTFHNAWRYFARAYGLTVAATVTPFVGEDPGARYTAGVVETIKKSGVKAVFAEPQLPPGPARNIAAEAGVRLAVLDPEGSTLAPDYAAMMRRNRDVLLEALR